jgi:hypothetical protein
MNNQHEEDSVRAEEWHPVLRAAYAAPDDHGYWRFLERRIMARISSEAAREWWSYFPSWSRAGLAAAALALMVAGVATWQTSKAQERVAWQESPETPNEMPVIESAGNERANRREATLRYLMSQ